MRKIIVIILIILSSLFLVPKYLEVNDLRIIDEVYIVKDSSNYKVYLREVIPKRNEGDVNYDYKIYSMECNDISNIKTCIKTDIDKFYIDKVKHIYSDSELNVKYKYKIINNIEKKIGD